VALVDTMLGGGGLNNAKPLLLENQIEISLFDLLLHCAYGNPSQKRDINTPTANRPCRPIEGVVTVARRPNFRLNNSKEALKNCPWPEKIGGRKMAKFGKKWQKNIFTII
jgi:hypothetical protein